MFSPKLIIAFDFLDLNSARTLLSQCSPEQVIIKIGLTMYTRFGAAWVKEVVDHGFKVFLDLKFHDIPKQVAGACQSAADLGVWMINVHCLGGLKMMIAAREALVDRGNEKPLLIGVTILTSMNDHDISQIGINRTASETVINLASVAKNAGLDGLVCSAMEAKSLKQHHPSFKLVTPGIRPLIKDQLIPKDDQQRIVTPLDAINNGSDYLVVGRPITLAREPKRVIQGILLEMDV